VFDRASRRLAFLYVGLFALVLAAFSVAFWIALAFVLQPSFDLAQDEASQQVAQSTYQASLQRVAVALIAANAIVIAIVAGAAWLLARRTLRPIQDATKRQLRFVTDASHEIRSPLAAIRATAEAALIEDRSADDLRAALSGVVEGTDRLTVLANDLLLLARTDQRPLPAAGEPIDLSVAVAEAIEAGARHVTLSLTPDLRVRVDPLDLARIVTNLVDNGIRYGGGSVRVRTLSAGGEALLEVSDQGPGIAPDERDQVFQPFYRGRAASRPGDGVGLGLSIAQGLARRNGARLSVESAPGRGATFRVAIPVSR